MDTKVDLAIKSTKLDRKVYGTLCKTKDGTTIPSDEYVVFLAKDNAFPATLRFYLEECQRIGAGELQVEAVRDLIKRVDVWRANNPDRLKVPDVLPGELVG